MSCKPKINKFTSLLGVTVGGFCSFAAICAHRGDEFFYSEILMPFVTRFIDPELAHDACITLTKHGLIRCQDKLTKEQSSRLATQVFGLNFLNPIGIAAGFDKNCQAAKNLHFYGLGFVEVGTVTPLPQPGNSKKRIFRALEHQALVNRCGFNSIGLKNVVENIQKLETIGPLIMGLNLGKNKSTIDISSDYVYALEDTKDLSAVDYIVINISSPNTPNLRQSQEKEKLEKLLDDLLVVREKLTIKKPLLLKIAPDVTHEQKKDIARLVMNKKKGAYRVDGLILTNTTITRPLDILGANSESASVLLRESGGMSGKPLKDMSTRVISDFYKLTNGKIPIIGVGGVFTGEDAYEKIKSGASLVQVYTALTYEGPPVINKIKQELAVLLERDGFKSVSDAVGFYHRKK